MREVSENFARYPSHRPSPASFREATRPESEVNVPADELSWNAAVEVLGVTHRASEAEITAAFRRLASQYHPDRITHLAPEFRTMAEDRMRRINAAYARLRNGRS